MLLVESVIEMALNGIPAKPKQNVLQACSKHCSRRSGWAEQMFDQERVTLTGSRAAPSASQQSGTGRNIEIAGKRSG
ncbi:MAG TPA: hypothetical protein VGO18_34790, partial [Steroidobacteraceae bacterium]|nr:hypothetical protein [Steroidobacteraceae bacterium]